MSKKKSSPTVNPQVTNEDTDASPGGVSLRFDLYRRNVFANDRQTMTDLIRLGAEEAWCKRRLSFKEIAQIGDMKGWKFSKEFRGYAINEGWIKESDRDQRYPWEQSVGNKLEIEDQNEYRLEVERKQEQSVGNKLEIEDLPKRLRDLVEIVHKKGEVSASDLSDRLEEDPSRILNDKTYKKKHYISFIKKHIDRPRYGIYCWKETE